MRVLFNYQPLAMTGKSGVPYYLDHLFRGLKGLPGWTVHKNYLGPPLFSSRRINESSRWMKVLIGLHKVLKEFYLPVFLRLFRYDAYVETEYYFRPRLPMGRAKYINIVYDFGLMKFNDINTSEVVHRFRRRFPLTMRSVDVCVTLTRTTADELHQLIPDTKPSMKTVFTYCGTTIPSVPTRDYSYATKYGDYFLFLGTLEPRKNPLLLVEAFHEYRRRSGSQIKLLMVGKLGWLYNDVLAYIQDHGLQGDVVLIGYAKDSEKAQFLLNAKAFVFLSKYEGFGIPPLEALQLGIPTLLSDIPVFRELYAGFVRFCPIDSVHSVATGLEQVLQMPAPNPDPLLSRFSWSAGVKSFVEAVS